MPASGLTLSPGSGRSAPAMAHVAALHSALTSMGFAPPPGEAEKRRFGPGTGAAVRALRNRFGLPPADTVDDATNPATG